MQVHAALAPEGLALACQACQRSATFPLEEPAVFHAVSDFLDLHRPCAWRQG